ncbi:hypothetical protein DTO021D3_7324 [Paecilomyces variotii]|nr:hypothetical protein DTO032I3_7606 [Paecilomyces variotii]KAJ9275810.1 hypothetical protein DTO021D3_7324 [Paecilomyces variotii]KAJ9340503.1 hypothetical protein DTO027B6_6946 [Paecilomyces variotii]KAJ9376096.1 hypothetical protein DTO032I4_8735 [Paecilomyces variotii]
MAEEPQLQTLQQRIAALNHAQVGRNPSGAPASQPSRPTVTRNIKTVSIPPHQVNGAAASLPKIGNEPAGLRQDGLLPPPTIRRTGQKPDNNNSGTTAKTPPLPARKSPALPPRRPSSRRDSLESTTSGLSISTIGSTGTSRTSSTLESGPRTVRAPAWGETQLPPLPPKRSESEGPKPALPSRPRPRSAVSERSLPPRPPPRLPSRQPSNDNEQPPVPKLPPRRPNVNGFSKSANAADEHGVRPPPRNLPPPAPSSSELDKIRQSSFAGLNKQTQGPNIPPRPGSVSNGTPPPVPDLSKIQATKPRLGSNGVYTSQSTGCVICRDYSGPDTRAAQYPRHSLPTQDLAWLARELTAPFPSATDKARVIFTWLHHNIAYDVDAFFNDRVKPSTPANTLATGLAVCEGYAGLFSTLATYAGLEAIVVGGHGKGFGFQNIAPGSALPPFRSSHAWNAVKIDGGKWKLIDPCWGAGVVNGRNQPYTPLFNPSQFTMSNDEFGLRHYPENKEHFFRDDGRIMSWEEYIFGNGFQQPHLWSDTGKNHISEQSFLPATKQISIYQPGPLRFQFNLLCPHWSVTQHSKQPGPYVFVLMIHGIDGREDQQLPFEHVRGSNPNGGGDVWYLDIPDPRILGAPGQKLQIASVTSFGDLQDAHGLTVQEFREKKGRVGMAFAFIAEWELVA